MPSLESPDVASLTLARHPWKTLYYFSCSVASGTASAAHFVATHPVTLGVALPVLLLYAVAKALGLYVDATGALEVRMSAVPAPARFMQGQRGICCMVAACGTHPSLLEMRALLL